MSATPAMQPIHTVEDLEGELSRPTPGVHDALKSFEGDVLVLGAGGKMGPTLARMVRRGLDAIGHTARRVIAVSRFSSPAAAAGLHEVLRRQGLLEGLWCLDEQETLSPGQLAEIDRVYAAYPHLNDDDFVMRHRDEWLG